MSQINPLYKRPAETRRYAANWNHQPELRESGDTLSVSPTVSAAPSGLTVTSPGNSGGKSLFTVAGGTDGTDYDITVTTSTTGGAALQEVVVLKVRKKQL